MPLHHVPDAERLSTMTAKHADPRRVQFDLLPDRLAEFDRLISFCDLRTRKDLFDNAMTLFEWAVHEVQNGKEIASYDRNADHVEVVRLPVLENAARRAKSPPVQLVDTSKAPPASVEEQRQKTAFGHERTAAAST